MSNAWYRRLRYQEKEPMVTTCDICTELICEPNKLFKNPNRCAHPICVNCIIRYINAKLSCNMSQIKCPALNCTHNLDPLSCRPIIPSLVFDKWCDLLCDSALLRMKKCYCPNRECSVLILNECGWRSVSKSECPKCKKLFCFSCQVAWHAGYSCKEARKLRDRGWHDVASGILAENNKWKRCPACHHCVERTSGCNFVRCRCGASFCYRCGGKVLGRCERCSNIADPCLDIVFVIFAFSFLMLIIQLLLC